ncbi:MAG: CHC2 zinc finger domain-containing protein [Gammaproteobacteria bacterium]|nr:CHC2 zinc finger domain-containing protein [Gammaproteobacteria bacterium]MDX2486194.1 CHC2 zinc finger domain-containing protein [Gammaproteobacteria bacterium]
MENCSITIDSLLSRLDKVRSNGHDKWIACCPAHDDRSPSMSITTGDDGRILMHCFAGCSVDEITRAIGIQTSDLFQDGGYQPNPLIVPPAPRKAGRTSTTKPKTVSRRKLMDALEHELLVQLVAIGHIKKRITPDPRDRGRGRLSAIRIEQALEALYEI